MSLDLIFKPDLVIEVTNTCDMACKGCYAPNVFTKVGKLQTLSKNLTLHELEAGWPVTNGNETVSIRGGEPTLNPELIGILDFVCKKVPSVYLETNGSWLEYENELLNTISKNRVCLKLSFDKMHGVDLKDKNSLIEKLLNQNILVAIAITTATFEEFDAELGQLDLRLRGRVEIFWQKKATKADELIRPELGVINIYGILKGDLKSKFTEGNPRKLVQLIFFLVFFVNNFSNSQPLKTLSVGLASNFSDVSASSSNPFGNYFSDGVELAIKDRERELNDEKIKIGIKKFDYGTSQTRVVPLVKEAADSSIIALLGYNYSSHALIAAPLHVANKLPMITPSATANRLSSFDDYVHPTCFNNAFMGETLAELAKGHLKAKRVAIVVAKDCAYCQDLAIAFSKKFVGEGRVIKQLDVLDSDTDFKNIIVALNSTEKFDAILVPNHELTSAKIISSIANSGFNIPFIGGDGWGDAGKEFFSVLGSASINAYTVTHWHIDEPSKKSKQFVKKYRATFGKDPNDTAVLAYDAMTYLIQVILKEKAFTRAALEQALKKKQRFLGVSGVANFDQGKSPKKSLVVLKIRDNKFVYHQTVRP